MGKKVPHAKKTARRSHKSLEQRVLKKRRNAAPQESKAQASPQRTPNGEEKRGRFAITLTREEIEDDVFAMTGARPSRTGLQSSMVIIVGRHIARKGSKGS
ncbi:hypothetical protein RJ640_007728 [Escallonia rubra]|uniref:Uncharacterized protein n=1 Tax=Escallonia rubra TaxID=112253 RepID=A0AA88QYA5_9ASTE|nr:hypothetical protein RJ640_007728 [Escallonia rubra]